MDPASPSAQDVARERDGTLVLRSSTYAIGDYGHGGVVFYVNRSGDHGKVVSIYDVEGVDWSNVFTEIGSSAQSDVNGAGNSIAITLQTGHVNSAAQQCLDLAYGGYDDWYLPSKDELNSIYMNRVAINATAIANGGEAFKSSGYWSSTESDDDSSEAWNQNFFGGGGQQVDTKIGFSINFRAIRAF